MYSLGSLVGVAAGMGVGFAAAHYLLKPRKKTIVAYLQSLLDELPAEIVVRRRAGGHVVYASKRGVQQLGGKNDPLPGQSASDPPVPGSGRITAESNQVLALQEAEVEREFSIPAFDGQPARRLESKQAPVRWPGEEGAVACVLTDVTRHRQAEAKLRAEVEFERGIFDTAHALFMVLDREGRIERQNAFCTRLFGPLPGSVPAALPFWTRAAGEESSELENRFLAVVREGSESHGISRMACNEHPGGAWIAWTMSVLGDGGESPKVLFTGTDETLEVETEQQRARLERMQEAIWRNAPEALALLDSNGTIRQSQLRVPGAVRNAGGGCSRPSVVLHPAAPRGAR